MGLTYGFYNSLNGDRKYDSTQLSNMFDGLVTDGVYSHIGDAFAVKATTGNIITIGTGRSWFSHTWTLNDALFPITLDQSDVLLNRYDVIVMEIGINNRMNYLKWVKGTPATTAVIPTLTNTNLVKQKPLAIIYRKAGSTSIVQADITNKIGTADCPFSTAILQSVSIDNMIAQWEDQWNTWIAGNKGEFDTWFNQMKGQLTTDAAGKLTVQANKIDSTIGSDYIVSTPSPITTSGLNLVIPAGFQYVCAEGFNADGSVKAVVRTIAVTLNRLNLAASSGHTCFLQSDATLHVATTGNYKIVGTLAKLPTTIPDTNSRLYYVTDKARYYKTSGSTTANWQPVNVCKIGYVETNTTQITNWMPEPTMIMSDLNTRVNELMINFKKYMYNVGDVITKTVLVTPTQMATEYGGEWVEWGSGRVPIGVDAAQTEFNTVEKVGGDKNHTNTEAEMFRHNHSAISTTTPGGNDSSARWTIGSVTQVANTLSFEVTGKTGSSTQYSIMNPYITCYMWKKIA